MLVSSRVLVRFKRVSARAFGAGARLLSSWPGPVFGNEAPVPYVNAISSLASHAEKMGACRQQVGVVVGIAC
jgi:hypothetical protein